MEKGEASGKKPQCVLALAQASVTVCTMDVPSSLVSWELRALSPPLWPHLCLLCSTRLEAQPQTSCMALAELLHVSDMRVGHGFERMKYEGPT